MSERTLTRVLMNRRDYAPIIRGLWNSGLSCCVNALLQSMFTTEGLLEILDRWKPSGHCEERNNVLLQLRKALHTMGGESPQPDPHREFLDCLHRNSIHRTVQHDAHEVFLSILNLLQQQMTSTQLKEEILDLYKVNIEGHVRCLVCTFDHEINSYLLSFPLALREGQNNLEACMQSFFTFQELTGEDECYCERCGKKQPSAQGFKLRSLPKILCIHLKRFRHDGGFTRKLNRQVTFSDTLNVPNILKPEHISEVFQKDDSLYSLYAVVVHSGFATCGHYTAFIRQPGEQSWYYADDDVVRQVKWDDVQSSYSGRMGGGTAYMLLYRRQSTSEDQGFSG
ncbi:ubl carboxyl-terminal hydrolase 18 [Clupea harengus]|uniref:Ubl carboxyl-terminal hydrolase 18 n=1 Tax=Clupea harengus TaxID=7950 RepID=A0A6P3VR16_CLUHA|nr:ubl carboxyl-terminal hydrolase 18 [Clupea harengus]